MMKKNRFGLLGLLLLLLTMMLLLAACGGEEADIVVSFNSDGGTAVESISLPAETPISLPAAPEREGYRFLGWTLEGAEQTIVEDGYEFPAGTTAVILRALWEELPDETEADGETADAEENGGEADVEENTSDAEESSAGKKLRYTVTFDSRGGSAVESMVVDLDKPLHLGKNPTRDGYIFITWEDKWGMPVGHGQEDYDVELSVKAGETVELFAVWAEDDE